MASVREALERAAARRKARRLEEELKTYRLFHGPGESHGNAGLRAVAVDRFGDFAWVTEWEERGGNSPLPRREIEGFLKAVGVQGAVLLARPVKGVPEVPEVLFGKIPEGRFEVLERDVRFRIQLLEARHPGLFLDHEPLRRWLRKEANGRRVLNLFAYTGSLSVAAGKGGADSVLTVDLSKATTTWAQENARANGLGESQMKYFAGDVFEELPRLHRKKEKFDLILSDPPSFSRGKKGVFSTQKDLKALHTAIFELLAPGGIVVTSINSANVSTDRFDAEVFAAARGLGLKFQVLRRVEQPETFPTELGRPEDRYLKGLYLKQV